MPPGLIAKIRYRQRGIWDQLILTNGSVIGFKSCEQGRAAFEGTALHYLAFDEEPPEDIFDEARVRLTDYGGDWWITMTPVLGMTWTYDVFVAPDTKIKDVEVFTASTWDNAISRGGHIADKDVQALEDSITDPIMKRIRVYGEYHSQVGRIYKSFSRKIHGMATLPPEWLEQDGKLSHDFDVYVGIDTGRCFAAIFLLSDYRGNLIVFDEYYEEDKPIRVHAKAVLNKCYQWGVWPDFIIDPSSQFFVDLSDAGINPMAGVNDVEKGINAVQEYLAYRPQQKISLVGKNPRLRVIPGKCPRFMWEMARYQWDAPAVSGSRKGEKKNTPRKKDDHVMDASRYVIVSRPDPSRPPEGELDSRPMTEQIMQRVKDKRRRGGREMKAKGADAWGLQEYY